jgi:hypothetical protein
VKNFWSLANCYHVSDVVGFFVEYFEYVWFTPQRALPTCGRANLLANESSARGWPKIWLKNTLCAPCQLGLTKKLEANQTAAVGYGLAKFLVRPALAKNQTHPKSLVKNFPTHGLTTWMIIQTFYAGLNFSSRNLLDSASGGTFMSITLGAATKLLDNMMINYSEWQRLW